MTRLQRYLVGALIGVLALAAAGITWLNIQSHRPFRPDAEPKIIEFSHGSSLRTISTKLEEEGIIRSRRLFSIMTWRQGQTRSLHAGEYRLSASMSPAAILETLSRGQVVLHPLIVPEGYTTWEVAAAAQGAGIESAEKIESLARNSSFLKKLNIQAPTAEGYLFPETYHFPKRTPANKVLGQMIETFWKRFSPDLIRKAKSRNFSIHQAVTLASIIERETAVSDERPLIAAVFQNRLLRGMRLQADPTVLYALGRTSGPLSRRDLKVDSPYNTYRVKGLPPGPIANPGLASLRAALSPAPVDFLYFVARGDGTHVFSRTLREHLKAVSEYRRWLDENRTSSNNPP
jgi:UPF0755 protein